MVHLKMEAPKFCVICCVPFTSSTPSITRGNLGYSALTQKLKAFSSRANLPSSSVTKKLTLFGCPKCVTCVSSTLTIKENISGGEIKVRRLQLQILKLQRKVVKMLRELEVNIGGFKEEVQGLEGILEEGGNRLSKMDEYFGDEEDLLKEAIQFREKIIKMKGELNEFSSQLDKKSAGINSCQEKQSCTPVVAEATEDDPSQTEVEDKTEEVELFKGNDQEVHDEDDAPPWSPENDHGGSDDDNESDKDKGQSLSPKSEQPTKRKKFKDQYADLRNMFPTLKIKAMGRYKRRAISHFAQQVSRDNQLRENDPASAFNAIDPLNNHPMTCDPTTNTFTMGEITLKINEQERVIECLKCGDRMQAAFGQFVYSHVLGTSHLNLLQCPFCPRKISDYLRFRDHVKGHEGKFPCDICGKPLRGWRYLKAHKWHHMNQEEKEEALKSGKYGKPPGSSAKKTGDFQCATCGKAFSNYYTFHYHEKTHLIESVGHICPNCGKWFKLKQGLLTHQRYSCYLSEKERQLAKKFQCDLCPLRFSHPTKLAVHKRHVHLNIRPFICGLCGKAFKRGTDLRMHERTHGDDRPFKCKHEGCGATFKTRNSTTKHEKRCVK